MEINEFQRWIQEYDEARGWDRVHPSQTLVHALEEMGEVARLVLRLEGYKPDPDRAKTISDLTEELGDLVTFLFKIAYQYGIPMETALAGNQPKAEGRYPVQAGRQDTDRYLAAQTENLNHLTAGWNTMDGGQ